MPSANIYPIHQSPLFKTTTKRRLASLLATNVRDLEFVADLPQNYREWSRKQKPQDKLAGLRPPEKQRIIQQPKAILDSIQKRLASLLGRIEKPDYVYSATKGRSYFDNALAHRSPEPAVKIDLKDFYPSVRASWVKDFFEHDMLCSADVAHLLQRICCANGYLPTGCAVSPVLSFFACRRMFDAIAQAAKAHELVFTLYVDDMVFTGKRANRVFLRAILPELTKRQLIGHKIAYFAPGRPKIVTGAAVWTDRIGMPNKRQKRIRFYERAFWKTQDPDAIELLGKALIGQYREGERIETGSRSRAKSVVDRMNATANLRYGDLTQVKPKPTKRPGRRPTRRRAKQVAADLTVRIAELRKTVETEATASTRATTIVHAKV